MAENSKIEWTDHTFNPWIGCTKVHEGCAHCYAEAFAKRYGKAVWGPTGMRVLTSEANWAKPLKWNRDAESEGVRAKVFCASLADVFEDNRGELLLSANDLRMACPSCGWFGARPIIKRQLGPPPAECPACKGKLRTPHVEDARRALFKLIDATPWLDWLLLTKRPENILRMWPGGGYVVDQHVPGEVPPFIRKFRENVWLGTSIGLQPHADKQIPELLKCRDLAPVLFLSCEPLLGPVNLPSGIWCRHHRRFEDAVCMDEAQPCFRWQAMALDLIDWLIVGGESGPHARPMHPAWVRSLRDQCQLAAVPFFFKQWGEWVPAPAIDPHVKASVECRIDSAGRDVTGLYGLHDESDARLFRVGKKSAGRLLDGREWSEFPEVAARA